MICFPNAKINIGLNITGSRPDGYHNIDTILFPVELCDVLEFVADKKPGKSDFNLNCTGIDLKVAPEDNICIKAYQLLKKDYNLPEISIHLHKIIPVGAGLGGGSSDAAYMLKNLNKTFQLNISNKLLHEYAGKLGSDCPFFIDNKTVFAYEKGNKFMDIDLVLSGYYIVIIYPNIQISSGEAYSEALIKTAENSLRDSVKLPVKEWKNVIQNGFENTIFPKYPEIKNIKKELYEIGAVYASLSGSGSALYGIFNKVPEIKKSPGNYFIWQYRIS
jgi:4-diphosphocytidyl-2-C-methyl-D-erythritol kinase